MRNAVEARGGLLQVNVPSVFAAMLPPMRTLEITTRLGCVLACCCCPQDQLFKSYPKTANLHLGLKSGNAANPYFNMSNGLDADQRGSLNGEPPVQYISNPVKPGWS